MEGSRKDSPSFLLPYSIYLRTASWRLLRPLGLPAPLRSSSHWSQSILPRIRNLSTCNARFRPSGLSGLPMTVKPSFILSVTRTPKTSGSNHSTVRRENRSPSSRLNKSPTFTGLSTAASWPWSEATPIPMLSSCKSPNHKPWARVFSHFDSSGCDFQSAFRNHKHHMIAGRRLYVLCHNHHRFSSCVQNRQRQLILCCASIPNHQCHLNAHQFRE